MDDKSQYNFEQRKNGVSAVRTGPGGRVETKMVTGERRKTTNGQQVTPESRRSLLDTATDLVEAVDEADVSEETEREIHRLLRTLTDRLRS